MVIMKPIEMIALVDREGIIRPLRYRILAEDQSLAVYKVDQVLSRTEEKLAGNKMFIYRCQGEINGINRSFELKYESSTCRWFLYRV